MKMTAFCRMDFLKSLSMNVQVDFVEEDFLYKAKTKLDLIDFLLNGCTIKTDLRPAEIEKNFDNPFIMSLMKKGRLQAAREQFQLLEIKDGNDFFSQMDVYASILIMNDVNDKKAKRFEDYHGYHCINKEQNVSILFDEKMQNFQADEFVNWSFAKDFLSPHYAIVIADPYIFKSATMQSLKELIDNVTSKRLQGNYYISLIGSSRKNGMEDEKFISKNIETLKEDLDNLLPNVKIIFEYHFCNSEDFHDRTIITNNTCIFSGYGLDMIKKEKSVKDTSWIAFKPFKRLNANGKSGVFFYKIMQNRLKQMRKWIDNNGDNQTTNPLLNSEN